MRKVTLGEVCSRGSSNIAQKDLNGNYGKYPIYGASGLIKCVDFYHQEKEYVAVVKDGAGIGRTMLLPANSSVIGTMQYLIPNEDVDVRYLYYAIVNMNLSKYFSGATIPHIYFRDYQNEEFILPSMSEQVEKADILGKLEHLIAVKQIELTKLDDLVKSRFVELFGDMADPQCKWDKCKLIDACADSNDIKCGPFGTQLGKDEYTDSGVEVWEIPQINSEFKTMPTHFVTKEKAQNLEQYSIRPGDIAMSRKGNVGRCAVFPESFEEGIIHSDVLRIRVDGSRVAPEFMMRQLHYSGDIQHQIELVSSGAIMAGINVTKLKDIFVYVPPKTLQDEFVSFVKQVDKSKLAVQKELEKLELLKKSLMQQYFG